MTPTFSTVLQAFAERLTQMENYETVDGESAAVSCPTNFFRSVHF